MTPIGIFETLACERYEVGRQPGLHANAKGVIRLAPFMNFEQALEDLEGFERIWVIFQFHRNQHWKPKVQPPRGAEKRGLFATRSPHRPNSIGLSCVELLEIKGLELLIGSHDLLAGTPVLDIKPYVPSADAFPDARAGWLEGLEPQKYYTVSWSELAKKQQAFILQHGGPDLEALTECRLQLDPHPHPSRRIRLLDNGHWELAYKTWRLQFLLDEAGETVVVERVCSGYTPAELKDPQDKWGDKQLHFNFSHAHPLV